MDTLLVNGDHYLDGRGLPVILTGDSELVQRALIRLSLRRGAFDEDPRLGSELHKLMGAREEAWDRLATSYAQEALAPMADVRVKNARVRREGRDALVVTVELSRGGLSYPLEVTVDGP